MHELYILITCNLESNRCSLKKEPAIEQLYLRTIFGRSSYFSPSLNAHRYPVACWWALQQIMLTLPGTNMEVDNGPERKTMKSTTNIYKQVVFHFHVSSRESNSLMVETICSASGIVCGPASEFSVWHCVATPLKRTKETRRASGFRV